MTQRRSFHIVIRWNHPRLGPQMDKAIVSATSIRRAVNGVLSAFFKEKSQRERRRAAHASLEVKCWREPRRAAQ